VPTLFRRKPADQAEEATVTTDPAETSADDAEVVHATRAYTPGKGRATPKRSDGGRRRPDRPPVTKEEKREYSKRQKEKAKSDRAEAMAGMRAGDERYLMPRDKGPERALARDVVDSRRTVGTWFFGTAFVVLLASGTGNANFALYGQMLWFLIGIATIADTVLICRKITKLVHERFPKSQVRPRSLYFYAFMRGITFRRLRMPQPRKKIGDAV
jgi:Protein of unknown function (DUF3043)